MSKWQQWYDSLSPSTKEYLEHRAIWTDQDLAKFSFIAFVFGVIIGILF
jgi:hypothetical protein